MAKAKFFIGRRVFKENYTPEYTIKLVSAINGVVSAVYDGQSKSMDIEIIGSEIKGRIFNDIEALVGGTINDVSEVEPEIPVDTDVTDGYENDNVPVNYEVTGSPLVRSIRLSTTPTELGETDNDPEVSEISIP
jgi:hypothetical protein